MAKPNPTAPPSPPPIVTLENIIQTINTPLPIVEKVDGNEPSSLSSISTTPVPNANTIEGSSCSSNPTDYIASVSAPTLATEDLRFQFNYPEVHSMYTHTETRMLIKTIMNGLKVLAYKLKEYADRMETISNNQFITSWQQQGSSNANPTTAIPQLTIRTGFARPFDLKILNRLFRKGLKVFELYSQQSTNTTSSLGDNKGGKPVTTISGISGATTTTSSSSNTTSTSTTASFPPRTKEEKELMDTFAYVFISFSFFL